MNNPQYISAPDVAAVPEEWKDRESWHFEAFVLHVHEDHCMTCSSVTHYSNVFRMFTRRSGELFSKRMIPATRIPNELSVIRYNMPKRDVPICHNCLSDSRISDVKILVSSDREWTEAVRKQREASEAQRRQNIGKTAAAKATTVHIPLDELL